MRTDLCVRAEQLGEMRVDVHVRQQVLAMDYPARDGGLPTPLEVLLASLAACAANTLALVLRRKMGVTVDALEVEARAERRAGHPTVLTEIELGYCVGAAALDQDTLDRALRTAEDMLCPVLAMLRPGTKITSTARIEAGKAVAR
jgi:uncharacterized OsmC-like protein